MHGSSCLKVAFCFFVKQAFVAKRKGRNKFERFITCAGIVKFTQTLFTNVHAKRKNAVRVAYEAVSKGMNAKITGFYE